MKTDKPNRERFYKPWHFIAQAGKRPRHILWEVFYNYHLDELKEELQCWQQLALCNDNSAYDEESAREDLMDFIQQLHRLIETFHILNERENADRKRKQLKGISKEAQQMIAKMNTPIFLTTDEKKNPEQIINQFCTTFRQSYVQMELLDMLDAVVTYKGDKKAYKGNLVLFYEHLHCLVRSAYHIYKQKGVCLHKLPDVETL